MTPSAPSLRAMTAALCVMLAVAGLSPLHAQDEPKPPAPVDAAPGEFAPELTEAADLAIER